MTRLLIRSAAACVAALFVLFPAAIPVNGQAPYRILLTNDDGIRAPGLAAMAQALKPLGEVTIIAPSENHSGTGHGISLSDPIYVDRVNVVEIVKAGGLPKGVFLNVNVPAGTALKGLKLARQSNQMGTERFDETKTPYGRRVLWSFFQQPAGAEPGSDVQGALDGYVAVTPLVASEFSQPAFDELQKRIR